MSEESEYESDEDHRERFKRWGFSGKANDDHTVLDTIHDIQRIAALHPEMLKGIVCICIFDHLESQEFHKKHKDSELEDKPPTPLYLMTGGLPIMEVIGSLQIASRRIDEQAS